MIAYITNNSWSRPHLVFHMLSQRKKLHKLAKEINGYRGLTTKWGLHGVTFMTMWKEQDHLNRFLNHPGVKREFTKRRAWGIRVRTITMPAYNFIPWSEVKTLIIRNSKPLQLGSAE